jgi:hypothetical protein
LPHSSIGVGSRREMLSAAGLMRVGAMRLLTNGAPRVSCRPPLHAADAKVVKSPAIIAAVGMNACWSSGFCRVVVVCSPTKKNSLSLTSGPPSVPPN